MGWISLLTGLLKLSSLVAGYVKDQQLINAGKAEAIVEGINHAMAFVDDAKAGAAGIDTGSDPEWKQRVLDRWKRK